MNTWACGRSSRTPRRRLRWTVTAVASGPYEIELPGGRPASNGKAKAVVAGGVAVPEGSFAGTISDKANHTRIGADGKTVVID